MSHNAAVRAYCRRTGRALELPRKQKRRLLDGLARELEERFPAENGLTVKQLCAEVGSPELSAKALMECAGEQERAWYRSWRRFITKAVVAVLAGIIIAGILYHINIAQYSIDHAEVRIIQNDTE